MFFTYYFSNSIQAERNMNLVRIRRTHVLFQENYQSKKRFLLNKLLLLHHIFPLFLNNVINVAYPKAINGKIKKSNYNFEWNLLLDSNGSHCSRHFINML